MESVLILKSWCEVQHRTLWASWTCLLKGFTLGLLADSFLLSLVWAVKIEDAFTGSNGQVVSCCWCQALHFQHGSHLSGWKSFLMAQPREALTNTQGLAHWSQFTSFFPLSSFFFLLLFKNFFTLIRTFHLSLQNDDLYVSKMLYHGVKVTFILQSFREYSLYSM